MPRIYDNIKQPLVSALINTLKVSHRADFCVGYFNLRGWKEIYEHIDLWPGEAGHCCRLLVGMQRFPKDDVQLLAGIATEETFIDQATIMRLRKKLATEFREQLTLGTPTNADEHALRKLATQLREKKVVVKLFLKYPLHAKLYLLYRDDYNNPITGYMGSSNLTFSGLKGQGELNIDVVDSSATTALSSWFNERWEDRCCIDISQDLIEIIAESWAREVPIPPHHIYVKMAYHLSQEARAGLSEFRIPKDFRNLFAFQTAAVKIAAHHLNKRGGVLIGDVVGLGKTLMATALARLFEEDFGLETLIICPKNLVPMWESYAHRYRLRAKVLPISRTNQLAELQRYRIVLIDESHNLRNRGKRFNAIQEYIKKNDSKCILLSATPYNKTYLDLANQLRLFIPEDLDLGVRPEQCIKQVFKGSEHDFVTEHQCNARTLVAFEKSEYADDWRELMRMYLVRRTRGFIQENYAETDTESGRKYLKFEDGTRSYFPARQPKTVKFTLNEKNPDDQYARLYTQDIVEAINLLHVPRYGLGNYVLPSTAARDGSLSLGTLTATEQRALENLSRAGKRLMGFCRTNLFKRLESGGDAFIQSIERHILRNYIFLHAIENGKPLPIGTQDIGLLDTRTSDEDTDADSPLPSLTEHRPASSQVEGVINSDEGDDSNNGDEGDEPEFQPAESKGGLRSEKEFKAHAAQVYANYETVFSTRFDWLRSSLFTKTLAKHLKEDAKALQGILERCGVWLPEKDEKLCELVRLLTEKHPTEKVLIFSQFADTVRYLESELQAQGIAAVAGATGGSADPTRLAWQFSPVSNDKRAEVSKEQELRVLVATDILSEGQNLQDAAIVINYDLPWAIIRLIQRVGRIDRIGQRAETIRCYSFLPAEGIERIIQLRARVRVRLRQNADVIGTDESFFEDEDTEQNLRDLFTEKSGILDTDSDTEVDLASYAYQIWKNAITENPALKNQIEGMPPVVFSTKQLVPETATSLPSGSAAPEGVLVYMQTPHGTDSLAWIDAEGKSITQSQLAILKAAECKPETAALARASNHHELVQRGVELMMAEEKKLLGGNLGPKSGVRRKVYERLQSHVARMRGSLFESLELEKAIEDISEHSLLESAKETLSRQIRGGITDETLAGLVLALRNDDRLCSIPTDDEATKEPKIICSLGVRR